MLLPDNYSYLRFYFTLIIGFVMSSALKKIQSKSLEDWTPPGLLIRRCDIVTTNRNDGLARKEQTTKKH